MDNAKINRALEILRFVGVGLGVYFAFDLPGRPVEQFRTVEIWMVLSLAGLTGIESVFFGASAATLSGYGTSAYQRQSGFNNLAVALAAIVSRLCGWGLYADAAICTVVLFFFALSAGNHLYSALKEGNRTWRSFQRPAVTAVLLAAVLPLMIRALRHAS